MANSPVLVPLPDSPILTPLPDSDDECHTSFDELEEARCLVMSYCRAFDSEQHFELLRLIAPDVTLDWFGQKVQGSQSVSRFVKLQVPQTRHLGVDVECVERSGVSARGKLQFARPGVVRKARKQWHWERNFRLRLGYQSNSHRLQRVVYERASQCSRNLFS